MVVWCNPTILPQNGKRDLFEQSLCQKPKWIGAKLELFAVRVGEEIRAWESDL